MSAATAIERPHQPLTDFYKDPRNRPEYVSGLFDASAEHYDWVCRVLGFGTDRFYRRMALRNAGLGPGMRLLDVATGTGLVSRAALELGLSPADITGIDPSPGMLRENQRTTGIQLIQGFGEKLPFANDTFDFISMGYALRHVESLPALFTEFRRVLKPGGRALILEISRPDSEVIRFFLKTFMAGFAPLLARFRTNRAELRELLRYYWATIDQCVPPATIVDALKSSGFASVERRRFGPVLNDYFAQRA